MYVLKQRILQAKARRGKKRRISDKNFWREVRVWEFFVFFLGFASVEKLGFDGKNILFFDAAVFLFFLEAVEMERHREFEVLYYRHIYMGQWARGNHILVVLMYSLSPLVIVVVVVVVVVVVCPHTLHLFLFFFFFGIGTIHKRLL